VSMIKNAKRNAETIVILKRKMQKFDERSG
jgi:hypothetical protein